MHLKFFKPSHFFLNMSAILLGFSCNSQQPLPNFEPASDGHTLLWEISGKNLPAPSYLFGTMHILCASDAVVSPQLRQVIDQVQMVYLELDMDDPKEVLGGIRYLSMKGDTTLNQLLAPEEYQRVMAYFDNKSPLPANMIKTYKPMLLASLIAEQLVSCKTKAMDLQIVAAALEAKKEIKGLETLEFQAGVFDEIPYAAQAQELLKTIDSLPGSKQTMTEMFAAYKSQNLDVIDQITRSESGMVPGYLDKLLYDRNKTWVGQINSISTTQSTLYAVGAGHLPGARGVLQLLKDAGYTVRPLKNTMAPSK
jgi:hypothetical protein